LTGSHLANFLLGNWEEEAGRFVKVFPLEYKRVLEKAMKVG
jgi:glutamate synthase (NADPH/NADH) large chain